MLSVCRALSSPLASVNTNGSSKRSWVANHSHMRDLRCFQPKQRNPQPFQVNRHCRLASKVMRHHSVSQWHNVCDGLFFSIYRVDKCTARIVLRRATSMALWDPMYRWIMAFLQAWIIQDGTFSIKGVWIHTRLPPYSHRGYLHLLPLGLRRRVLHE